jgi:hypothetical protein
MWFLGVVTHIPLIGKYLGEANMPMMIILMLLFAGCVIYAKIKWGQKVPIGPDAGFITKIKGGATNIRAGFFGFLGSFGMAIVLLSFFATGALGTGSELDLGMNITVLPSNNYNVVYSQEGTRNKASGWHAIIHQPTDQGGWDVEHPFAVFIPQWSVVRGFATTVGEMMSISLFQNRYSIAPPIPEQYADPTINKEFIGN